ncbi:exocyst complex component Exo84p [Trichomonascus vanleenenianus]|uniref:exocyst subunit EXO84 n=1 Tax=Trichomonascus vanleenenianus TaxID=2268995 RepID=UPI003ECB89BF
MSSESLGVQAPQSLRKHRQTLLPDQTAPRKDYGALLNVPGQENLPSVAAKDRQKVGNLVKKRYSSRVGVNDIYDQAKAPALPLNAQQIIEEAEEPAVPHAQYGEGTLEEEPSRKMLERETFDAEKYISHQLSSATDVEIASFAEKLTSMQDQLVVEKKETMYKNYKTFLHVGKEITYLGTELDSLRKLLNDMHLATTAMKEDAVQALASRETKPLPTSNSSQSSLSVPESPGGGLGVPRRSSSSVNANRNSMLMLENMWAQDMANLFRHVEGAQKYLPAVPGRHVIVDSGGWYQLNTATWKPVQPAHMLLLNDHLLVAVKKRQRQGDTLNANNNNAGSSSGSRKLVADQCWPLQEIEISELVPKKAKTDSEGRKLFNNALCIKTGAGATAFVYRIDKPSEHFKILQKYRNAKEELRALKGGQGTSSGPDSRKAQEDKARLQSSMDYYANQTPTLKNRRELLEGYSTVRKSSGHSRHASVDLSGKTKTLREIDELINDLDVKIAYRQFDGAVRVITKNLEELKDTSTSPSSSSSSLALGAADKLVSLSATAVVSAGTATSAKDLAELTRSVMKIKIEQRSDELSDILLRDLSQNNQNRDQAMHTVNLLIRLGHGTRAKETFLEARRGLIRGRIKHVEFQGDIVGYVTQVAIIHFRLIRATVEMFNRFFNASRSSSSLVEWAKNEVEEYILLYARQLYNIDPQDDVSKTCARVTKRESDQLKEVGLDLSFMLAVIVDPVKHDPPPSNY